ncbi:TPA: MFS transporter [Legionella pneumophila]
MNFIGWTERQSLFRLFPLIISISFAMDVFVPAIPEMSRYFNTDSTTMQATLYLFMLTVALGQLCWAFGRSFWTKTDGLEYGTSFFAGSLISALAPSVPALIFARIIQAAGACGTYLLCFIIVRDNFSTGTCARLFSILSGTNSMVASSAPVIGGLLLDMTQDWHSGFYFLTLLGLLMTGIAFRYIPDYHYPKPELLQMRVHQVMRQIISNSDFRQYTWVASASLLGLYLFCAQSPGILITQLYLSATEYGFWFGLNAMTVFVANMMAARLTYSHSLESIVRWGLVLMTLSCFFMLALNLRQCSILSFMLPMLCLTVGIGISMGTATALALKDFEQQAGVATALLGACQFGLAGLIGVLTAQWMPGPLSVAIPVLCFTAVGLARITKFSFRILSGS